MKEIYPDYRYSEEDVKNQIAQLFRLDYRDTHPFDEFHSHNYYEIFVFFEGGGEHNINFNSHKIQHNSIHLLAANHLHWLERSKTSKGFFIIYKEEFLQKLVHINPHIPYSRFFSNSRLINLTAIQAKTFSLLFQELQENTADGKYMLSLIGTFLTKLALTFPEETIEEYTYDPLVNELNRLINIYFKNHLSTVAYAAKLHTSPANLQKKVKAHTGKSVKQLQQERLLKEAKYLLHHPKYSISEVAFELGFKQPAHFSAWFKQHTQISPKKYKG